MTAIVTTILVLENYANIRRKEKSNDKSKGKKSSIIWRENYYLYKKFKLLEYVCILDKYKTYLLIVYIDIYQQWPIWNVKNKKKHLRYITVN